MQIFKKILFIFIFKEKGKEGERDREKYQCVVASHVPHTGDQVRNPGMCPNWESTQRPFGSRAGTQSTEPHQLGLKCRFLKVTFFKKVLVPVITK